MDLHGEKLLCLLGGGLIRGERLLGTGLRNLVEGIIRCPLEAGLRCLRGGGLRCLHGTELTSPLEKDLSPCPKEGLCACVEDRAFI
ncbi:UNVERIFIED_CONTAM: hypothetical protein Slati_0935200 [Sesamum latifolium]|uniref:Uncharacterized protein n=1 Tax=Sesamum latifolium TaxID=2727402 RepID=A0AAW2XQY6_9LAMI